MARLVARFLGVAIPAFLVGVAMWDWLGLRTWAVASATEIFMGAITQNVS